MEEWLKETITPKNLRLIEKESVPKPKATSQVMKALEEYKESEREAAMAKRQLYEDARNKGASSEDI